MARYRLSACTAIDQGDREEQQDRVMLMAHPRAKGCVLALVADGMGGKIGGAMAAEQVMSTARQVFSTHNPDVETAEPVLRALCHEAHTVIRLSALSTEQEPHSTAVGLMLQGDQATWFHVGDSRLYLFRHGALLRMTEDHSYVNQLVREGRVAPEQAKTHRLGHILTRALGSQQDPEASVETFADLQPGDAFLLCSDGLWHYAEAEELGAIVANHPVREASEKLIALARQRADGTGDNVSMALLKLEAPAEPEPEPILVRARRD